MKSPLLFLLLLFGCGAPLFTQEGSVPALDYLRNHRAELGVTAGDLTELRVIDDYASPSGIRHVYVGQSLYGTPVFNAQVAVHFRGGKVLHHTSRLEANLRARTEPTVPVLGAEAAFRVIAVPSLMRLEAADLVYFPVPGSSDLRMAWQLTVAELATDIHSLNLVDAVSGALLYRTSLTLTCTFDEAVTDAPGGAAGAVPGGAQVTTAETAAGDGALYHVFPFGVESPLFGKRSLVAEPADPVASPYGWHDTNGEAGPEYTYTRGNNVYAYRDADEQKNVPDSGFVAEGGEFLDFDFPLDIRESPDTHVAASLTQLYYTSSMLHDWTYRHGFDEPAGNFQQNTYGRGGRGNDAILAEAQDGSGSNNANFLTLPDGRPGRLQLFLWDGPAYQLDVSTPKRLAGERRTGSANFGGQLTAVPVTGDLALGLDDSDDPSLGCRPLVNDAVLRGKIVLLDRGTCAFQDKAYHAEQAGAIAVIICNQRNAVVNMGKSGNARVTIPTLMLGRDDCAALRAAVLAGERVTLSLSKKEEVRVDGSFDNGVVAHEYAHGISTRLVGGPQTTTCLLNDEQMGEGWSDFFALASTPQAAGARPDGTEARGIGLYSSSGFPGERGFRSQPYSTDFTVNDHTYDDIITAAVPHGVGETWASVLWDLYWSMVDAYGFDEDLVKGEGGNNAAVRLVIEAMKYTPCRPGLVDGRDALLVADRLENGGANQCLLWEVFRRRGLGVSASQGSSRTRTDNREAFDLPPSCIPTLKLAKSADTATITAGEPVSFTLTLRNDRSTAATAPELTDELPDGTTLDPASITGAADYTVSRNQVTFTLDDLPPGEARDVTYSVSTDPRVFSTRRLYAGVETEQPEYWTVTSQSGSGGWIRSDTTPYAGSYAWYLPDAGGVQDYTLQLSDSVALTGPRPALRFFTKFRTEPGYAAGVVEVSADGHDWQQVDTRFLRYAYRGPIGPRGPEVLQNTPSFWGDSEGYREVIVDLSTYRGQKVSVRWRFVSAQGSPAAGGWWIDEVELLSDLQIYDGAAAVTFAEGDRLTARAPELGVVINSGELLDELRTVAPANPSLRVFPNPATGTATVSLEATTAGAATVELWTADGRRLSFRTQRLTVGSNLLHLPLDGVPAGVYTLRVREPNTLTSARLTVVR